MHEQTNSACNQQETNTSNFSSCFDVVSDAQNTAVKQITPALWSAEEMYFDAVDDAAVGTAASDAGRDVEIGAARGVEIDAAHAHAADSSAAQYVGLAAGNTSAACSVKTERLGAGSNPKIQQGLLPVLMGAL